MKQIKHSKYKNTGLLFELLTRQVTVDTIDGVKENIALDILKKYFNKKTELHKEYHLYDALMKKKINSEVRAQKFIDKVVETRQRIDIDKLEDEKYNLVGEIKDNYNIKEFLSTPINNYKTLASVYTLFEANNLNEAVNVSQIQECNDTLLDFIMRENDDAHKRKNSILENFEKQDEEIRMLAYKLIVEKFNKKYSGLNTKQKKLLREYINNLSNTNNLREYVNKEVDSLKKSLVEYKEKITSNVTKIKMKEALKLLDEIKRGNVVKNNQLQALLYYYEMESDLKRIHNG